MSITLAVSLKSANGMKVCIVHILNQDSQNVHRIPKRGKNRGLRLHTSHCSFFGITVEVRPTTLPECPEQPPKCTALLQHDSRLFYRSGKRPLAVRFSNFIHLLTRRRKTKCGIRSKNVSLASLSSTTFPKVRHYAVFVYTAGARLCVFAFRKLLDLNQLPSAPRQMLYPNELNFATYVDERAPVVSYLSARNATHQLLSHLCYSPYQENQGVTPNPPFNCGAALVSRLELRPLRINRCHSLSWLRLLPARAASFHLATLLA